MTIAPTEAPAIRHAEPAVVLTEAGRYRADIDGLRAVAILSVLAFHAFPDWISGGFVGVDVFFVISGFLISRIVFAGLADETFGFRHFYARRARRIFPSLAVVLVAALVLGWFVLSPSAYAELGRHVVAGAGFVSNVALWLESGYFDSSADTKPLLHLWSLGIEEQFYIVFPLVFYFAARWRIARMPLLLGLGAVSFALNLDYTTHDASAAFYFPHTRFWELLAGCVLAHRSLAPAGVVPDEKVRGSASLCDFASVVGIVAIVVAILLLDPERRFPGWWALLPVLGACLLISAGPAAIINRRLLSNPLMVGVGLISFQLYLWHWPLLAFLRIDGHGDDRSTIRALAVAISFPLAWATYAWIDKPIRSGPRSHARTRVILACAALAIAGLAGLIVFRLDGLPTRGAESLAAIARFKFPYAAAYREGTCFLRPEQSFAGFGDCTQTVAGSDAVVLWGDSHAAHLYPGLEEASRNRFTLTQYTASSCAPILGIDVADRPHCHEINDAVFARITRAPPREVILAAYWSLHPWTQLAATIKRLLAAGVGRVVVVGQVPRWKASVPQLLYEKAKNDLPLHRVPMRLPTGQHTAEQTFDDDLARAVDRAGASYISALSILCNDAGCVTLTQDDSASVSAWDEFHLTTEGSKYLVSRFPAGSLPESK